MRVKTIETFKVPPRWLFVRIETESGLVGWGEPIVEGRADTVAAAVHEMKEHVVGRDAGHIEDIFQVLYRGAFYRGGPVLMSAISGIEQALWDIRGKSLNVPVYSLLGGPVRDKMKVYTWIGGDSPSDASKAAIERLRQGFAAVKMNGTANLEWVDSHRKVTEAVERVQAVREAVGDKADIAVDFHGRVHKPMAAVLMKALEPLGLLFVEEPVLAENQEAFVWLKRSCSIPIATGERHFGRWAFKDLLHDGGVDIIQPDLSHAGGILECRKIAAMAEAYKRGRRATLPSRPDCTCCMPPT